MSRNKASSEIKEGRGNSQCRNGFMARDLLADVVAPVNGTYVAGNLRLPSNTASRIVVAHSGTGSRWGAHAGGSRVLGKMSSSDALP